MHNNISKKISVAGFTLIELLVVIAIVAILSVTVVVVINPGEMLAQTRDSNRLSDLSTLKTSISLYLSDGGSKLASSSLGYAACYLSTPSGAGTTATKCGFFISSGITSNSSSSSVNYRKTDSTGWVPVNFTQMSAGTPFSVLPIDPINNASHSYAYAANASYLFEFGTFIESKKFSSGGNSVVTTSTAIYENGSTLSL